MDKKIIIIAVISGIFLLLIGIGLGMFIQSQNKGTAKKVEAVSNLSSRVISEIKAYGKVTKIEGKNITLSNLGDNLVVNMLDTARVYTFVATTGSPVQKTITLGDIKVGDSVNVVMKLLPSGQMQGSSVIVLPTASK